MVHVFWGSELHGTHHWPPAFKRALGTDHFGCQKGRPQCHGVKIKTISSRQKVASYGHNMPQYDIQIVESHLSHLSHLSFVICHVSHSRLCLYSARIARHAAIQSLAGLRRIFPERFHPRNPGCRGQCRCQQRTKDAAKHLSAESAVLKLSVNWLQQIIIRTDHSPTSSQNQYSQ